MTGTEHPPVSQLICGWKTLMSERSMALTHMNENFCSHKNQWSLKSVEKLATFKRRTRRLLLSPVLWPHSRLWTGSVAIWQSQLSHLWRSLPLTQSFATSDSTNRHCRCCAPCTPKAWWTDNQRLWTKSKNRPQTAELINDSCPLMASPTDLLSCG